MNSRLVEAFARQEVPEKKKKAPEQLYVLSRMSMESPNCGYLFLYDKDPASRDKMLSLLEEFSHDRDHELTAEAAAKLKESVLKQAAKEVLDSPNQFLPE